MSKPEAPVRRLWRLAVRRFREQVMWNGFGGMGWGWIGLGVVHMLLFWILVILGIVLLVRLLAGTAPPPANGGRALEILKERYARGELTREQYEQMKKELQ
jgi:putative membrane protein